VRRPVLDEAERRLAAATASNPRLLKAWATLATVRLMLGRPGEPDATMQRAVECAGRPQEAVERLLATCVRLGELDYARRQLRLLLDRYPGYSWAADLLRTIESQAPAR